MKKTIMDLEKIETDIIVLIGKETNAEPKICVTAKEAKERIFSEILVIFNQGLIPTDSEMLRISKRLKRIGVVNSVKSSKQQKFAVIRIIMY